MTEAMPELPLRCEPRENLLAEAPPESVQTLYTAAQMHAMYAAGMERAAALCAAEQAENRELAKGSKTAMYDWMADGAGLCLGAIRAAIKKGG